MRHEEDAVAPIGWLILGTPFLFLVLVLVFLFLGPAIEMQVRDGECVRVYEHSRNGKTEHPCEWAQGKKYDITHIN